MSDFVLDLSQRMAGWMATEENYFFPTLPTVATCIAAAVPAAWLMKRYLQHGSRKKRGGAAQNVSPNKVEEDSDSDNTPHIKKDADSAPSEEEDSNNTPPVEKDSDNTPLEEEDSDKTPPVEKDPDNTPHEEEDSDKTPPVEKDPDNTPHEEEDYDKTPPAKHDAGDTSAKNDTDLKPKKETGSPKEEADSGKPKKELRLYKEVADSGKPKKENRLSKEIDESDKPKKDTGPPKEIDNDLQKILDWALEYKKNQRDNGKWDDEIRGLRSDKRTVVTEFTQAKPKEYPVAPKNNADVEKNLRQAKNNDPELTHLNWNNIMDIEYYTIVDLFESLRTNTSLTTLDIANTFITNGMTRKLLDSLLENRTLRVLNLDSNILSGLFYPKVLKAINENQTVVELKLANQDRDPCGPEIEAAMAELVEQNNTLLRLGFHFECPDARRRVTAKLMKNMDEVRKKRLADKRAGEAVKK